MRGEGDMEQGLEGADFVGIYTEMEREARIKKELARLNRVLSDLSPDSAKVMGGLIADAAFMAVTLDETRRLIVRDGVIETYQNGANQSGRKKSSAVEVYDKMVNTYARVIRQICEGLPQGGKDAAEDIMKFALGKKSG